MKTALLARRRFYGSVSFTPAALFFLNEPGAWYDPSDLTTMFTDTAGTTQAQIGQAVALVLDKSKGLVLGPELVTNGTFDADLTGWTASGSGGTSAWADGKMVFTHDPTLTGTFNRSQNISVTSGATYRLSFSYFAGANAFGRINVPGIGNVNAPNTEQTIHLIVLATTSTLTLTFTAVSNSSRSGIVTVDNISVRELPGAHATQATVASRPILGREPVGGQRNLLTFTEEFDNAAWVKTRATISNSTTITASETNASGSWTGQSVSGQIGANTLSVDVAKGAGVIMLTAGDSSTNTNNVRAYLNTGTGVVGVQEVNGSGFSGLSASVQDRGSAWRLSISYTSPTANQFQRLYLVDADGALAVTSGRTAVFSFPQLELGSTATPYQRVTTAFDVTEQGVADTHYLFFDGVDDWLVTPTITPATDKVQVFAGVRRIGANSGIIAESSASAFSTNGAFNLASGALSNLPTNVRWETRGTLNARLDGVTSAVPVTQVLSGLGDISGDSSILRVNGAQVAQSTADQGTGNYLAYPLYIGRRGGTTSPFNGRIYSLVVRFGANLDAATITNAEKFVAGKTGITI
jgi:hypothetical protein